MDWVFSSILPVRGLMGLLRTGELRDETGSESRAGEQGIISSNVTLLANLDCISIASCLRDSSQSRSLASCLRHADSLLLKL